MPCPWRKLVDEKEMLKPNLMRCGSLLPHSIDNVFDIGATRDLALITLVDFVQLFARSLHEANE